MNKPEVTVRVEHSDEDGTTYCLSTISSIGIKRLEQVVSHQINHILDTVSHVVHFSNGGVLCFAYNKAGKLLELKVENLDGIVNKRTAEVTFEEEADFSDCQLPKRT
jgi:hypothetical protein